MEITNDIALYSMGMASASVAGRVQASMIKDIMDLQQDTMSQLFASIGVGGSLNVQG